MGERKLKTKQKEMAKIQLGTICMWSNVDIWKHNVVSKVTVSYIKTSRNVKEVFDNV